jgi:transposase InsO family protein
MSTHPRAKLGLAARQELCEAIDAGLSIRAAAKLFNVSPATAHKWRHRWLGATIAERRSLACLRDRSSRPHRLPNELAASEQERICELRRRTGWGPRLIAGMVGHPHSTVHRTLWRHRISRPARPVRDQVVRYEWPCPGDLLHMDTARYARFRRPGHRVTGDRSQRSRNWMSPETRVGYDFCHAIVDDHTRLAYVELHPDEKAQTVTGFVRRALEWFSSHGIEAKRLMTDNAFSYVRNRSLRELLAERKVRHLTTQPYRPRTNGKVERFHQTIAREWAYGMAYRSHHHRNKALPHWLRYYNQRRPHSGIGNRPPISRVHDLSGQDT